MTFLSSKWPGTATFPPIVVAHYDELLQPRRERKVSLHYEAFTYGRAGLKSIMEILEKLPQSDRASGLNLCFQHCLLLDFTGSRRADVQAGGAGYEWKAGAMGPQLGGHT